MENSTPLESNEPIQQPVPPPTRSKYKGHIPLIILMALLLLLVGGGAYYLGTQKTNSDLKNQHTTQTLTSSPTPENIQKITPSPEPTIDSTNDSKDYIATSMGFSFNYPKTWKINTFTVAKGKEYIEKNKYDVDAADGELQVIQLTKNPGWELRIEAQKEFRSDTCGGQGPVTNDSAYKKLSVFTRVALRSRYEDGLVAFMGGDQPEPFPLPVMFKRLPNESTQTWPTPDTDSSYVAVFCVENPQKPLRLKVTYYSTEFTQEKISNKTIDKTTLNEMDSILETLKVL